jgi:hypothetical protein
MHARLTVDRRSGSDKAFEEFSKQAVFRTRSHRSIYVYKHIYRFTAVLEIFDAYERLKRAES